MAEANRTWMRFQWRMHKLVWNLSGGRLGRKVVGMPVVEVVTIGQKSGQERQILVSYVEGQGAPAIIGTNAGRNVDPAWVKNLRANPSASARWDGKWRDVTAVELSGDEHEQMWKEAVTVNPGYANYRETLTRHIPIFRLESQ